MKRSPAQTADLLALSSLASDEGPVSIRIGSSNSQGTLHFLIQGRPGGIHVERDEQPRLGVRTIRVLSFTDRDRFRRWCERDPVRFDHPLLHDRLRRVGDELWGRVEPSPG